MLVGESLFELNWLKESNKTPLDFMQWKGERDEGLASYPVEGSKGTFSCVEDGEIGLHPNGFLGGGLKWANNNEGLAASHLDGPTNVFFSLAFS